MPRHTLTLSKNDMRSTLFILIVIYSSLICKAELEVSGTPEEVQGLLREKVTLVGQVEGLVSVDEAYLTLLVEYQDPKLSQAILKLNSMIKKIEEMLSKAEFEEGSIVFGDFSSTPNYGFFSKRPSSYSVVNKVRIKVQSDAQFVEVAKLIDTCGELRYSHIDIESSLTEEARDQAVLDAIKKIKRQKELYEQAFETELSFERFDTKFDKKEIRTDINLTMVKDEDEGFLSQVSSSRRSRFQLTLVEYKVSCHVSATYHIP